MKTALREVPAEVPNPLGLEGVEYIEYRAGRPQAMGHVLELMGFKPVARHRSREVLLYRQGSMNIVINGHGANEGEAPSIAAIALRVRDAAAAHARLVDLGGWDVPVQVQPMELHIPAIHGVGGSRIYLVDRWREFSIYDVDFVPVPGTDPRPPALAGMHWFGVVQYIGLGRTEDWIAFWCELFGFSVMGQEREEGLLPQGTILRSADGQLHLQLIEPEVDNEDAWMDERLQRLAFGAADVQAVAQALREHGVRFVESGRLQVQHNGALTETWLGTVMFELIHHEAR